MSKQSKNFDHIRSQILTTVRKDNNVLSEIINRMRLRMELPVVEKKYAKFLVRHEFSDNLQKAYLIVKPFMWIDYWIHKRWLIRKILKEIQGDSTNALTEND